MRACACECGTALPEQVDSTFTLITRPRCVIATNRVRFMLSLPGVVVYIVEFFGKVTGVLFFACARRCKYTRMCVLVLVCACICVLMYVRV